MAGMPNPSNTRGYFLGGTVQPSNSSHLIGSGAGQVSTVANTAMGSPSCAKNRRKAVLTVDAKTTEILIASESICALFRLKDRSLIGKKLAQVFQWKIRRCIARLLLIPKTNSQWKMRLKPVYGKPVDILDADGNKSTICLWKCSVILRSPSAYLPSSCLNAENIVNKASLNASDFLLKATSKTPLKTCQNDTSDLVDNCKEYQTKPASPSNLSCNSELKAGVPQRSKSTCANYSPYLNVLHENSEESQFSQHSNSKTSQESNEQNSQTACQSCRAPSETNNNNSIGHKSDHCNQQLDGKRNMVESRRSYQTGMPQMEWTDQWRRGFQFSQYRRKYIRNGLKQSHIGHHLIQNDRLEIDQHNDCPLSFGKNRESGSQHLLKMSNGAANTDNGGGTMQCILGAKGRIFRTDDKIHRLIPRLQIGIEWDNKTQMCCGTTIKRNGIPFSIVLHSDCDHDSGVANSFDLEIRSLSSINGVITITDSGLLYAYNENFLHELAGCELNTPAEKNEMDIKELIPDFYNYFEEAQKQQRLNEDKYFSCEDFNSNKRQLSKNSIEDEESDGSSTTSTTTAHSRNVSGQDHESSEQNGDKDFSRTHPLGSSHQDILPGTYLGLVKHVDGGRIPVKIEVTAVEISSNPKLFNVCVGFDRSNDYGFNQMGSSSEEEDAHSEIEKSNSGVKLNHPALAKMAKFPNMCYSASNCFSSTSDSLNSDEAPKFSVGGAFGTLRECDSDSAVDFIATKALADDLHSSASELKPQDAMLQDRGVLEDENNDAVRGEYSKHYDTFQLIGMELSDLSNWPQEKILDY
uniref:Uncharacterized protein n=1 Tax=Ditylenchus dipsaci TaxID=166011 RepID=A0A915D9V0_9BILA